MIFIATKVESLGKYDQIYDQSHEQCIYWGQFIPGQLVHFGKDSRGIA